MKMGRLLTALAAATITSVACGTPHTASQSSPSGSVAAATATASATPVVAPGEVPQDRPATADELKAMIAAGKKPAEAFLHLGDSDSCGQQQSCLFTDHSQGSIGINAGRFTAEQGCPGGCGGAGCVVYLYEDAGGWHFVNAGCAQSPGYLPGAQDLVRVSGGGCANVREEPGTRGRVVACLPDQTQVDVDSAPVYTEGKIWWHLKAKGWMAHDFLIAPPNAS